MLILDSNTKALQIVLASAVAANSLHFTASYADMLASRASLGSSQGSTDGANPVVIVAAPPSGMQRQIRSLSVHNTDTANAKVLLQNNDNGTLRNLFVVTLNPGDNLVYEDNHGFTVFDNTGASKPAGTASTAVGLVSVANNCNLPTGNNVIATNWVFNAWTKHKAGPAGYKNIRAKFVNWLISTNSEQQGYFDFNLGAGLYLNGQFYQFKFNKSSRTFVSKNYGEVWSDVLPITIPPNAEFYITNIRLAADNGAAGSYNVLTNTGGSGFRQDGFMSSIDPSQDFTLGVGLAYGAKALPFNATQFVSGAVSNLKPDPNNKGRGYTGGLNMNVWYGPAGAGAAGATQPGSGVTGYGTANAQGQLASITFSATGTGHDPSNPPLIQLAGSGSPATGFGNTTASYGPSMILGEPLSLTKDILLQGDSITAGYGSVDAIGDLFGNFGIYEQAFANRFGIHKLAVSGEGASGWLANNTRQLAFIDDAISRGLQLGYVVIALGVNDFLSNLNANVLAAVKGYVTAIANIWRARGAKVLMTTIPPACTTSASSNKFTTLAEQSPYNANYNAGSNVDLYNAALLNGTGPANDGVIDISTPCRDSTTPTKWRVDCFGGTTAFCAADGIHPSVAVGIPFLLQNLRIPPLN